MVVDNENNVVQDDEGKNQRIVPDESEIVA